MDNKNEQYVDAVSLLSPAKFNELKQKLADIPDSEFDVSVVHRKPTSDAVEILNRTFGNSPERRQGIDKEVQALRQIHSQFTEQQINDYCEKIDNLCLTAHSDGKLLFDAVQIIRQLQGCPTTTKTEIVD